MLKIAHIATDEKFIEAAVDIFESAYPKQNVFYITTPKPWSFIKDKKIYRQLTKRKWFQLLITQRQELKAYDVVIFHSLPTLWLIPMVIFKQNYVWLGWGGDYYSRSFCNALLMESLILPKTSVYAKSIQDTNEVANSGLGSILKYAKLLAKKVVGSKFFYKCAMRNVKVFSPVLPQEYGLVKERYGLGGATKYAPWNYGVLEKHLIKNIDLDNIEAANGILLGNSATATNNHFEALDVILKSDTSRIVYLPLSYGDPCYAQAVKDYISNVHFLSDRCCILDTFMPLSDYNSIMNNCGFVIMNHVRQQALGNIVAMMYRGAKIFLREESVLYKFFKGQGAHIYSVQELELDPGLLVNHLTAKQIEDNRKLLKQTWSEPVIMKRTIELVEKALS